MVEFHSNHCTTGWQLCTFFYFLYVLSFPFTRLTITLRFTHTSTFGGHGEDSTNNDCNGCGQDPPQSNCGTNRNCWLCLQRATHPPIPPSASCCLSLYHIVAVICTIDNCDCICYNAVTEGAAESWMAGWLDDWSPGRMAWHWAGASLQHFCWLQTTSDDDQRNEWHICLMNPLIWGHFPQTGRESTTPFTRSKETNRLCILITFYWFSHFHFIYLIYAN